MKSLFPLSGSACAAPRRIFSRRLFLRGAGVSLALPLLPSLACSRSVPSSVERIGEAKSALEYPKRFVFMYIPNGNFGRELPASLAEFGGNEVYAPLAPFASKLNVIRGLDITGDVIQGDPTWPGEPHQRGMGGLLTGRRLNQGQQVGGDGSLAGWGSGISIDQVMAEQSPTQKKSLHFGVQSQAYGGTEVRTVVSYKGSDIPVANEDSPYEMFNLVFKDLGADPFGLAQLRARRKAVLDGVAGQISSIQPQLTTEDRAKFQQHLQAVEDVANGLDKPGGVIGGHCQIPVTGDPINLNVPESYPLIGKLQMDLLTMSIACDLSRICTIQWSASTNNKPYPFLNYDEGAGPQPIVGDEHILGHQPDTDVHAWGKLKVIRKWYMEQFAYLIGALDSMEEGDGTMLDNTVVVLGSEITQGNTHSHTDAPFLLAGGCGGYFKTGQDLTYTQVSHSNLLVSLLNGMDIPATDFGEPGFCTGAIGDLVA